MSRVSALPSRRDLFRAGARGITGLTLPDLLRLQAKRAADQQATADACILSFPLGRPQRVLR